jgi:peptidoglycan/LPS O-acetylase OafA/YrhL
MRLYVSYPHRNDDVFAFMQTHLRSDGILAGVLISYLLNFTKFLAYFQRRKWMLAFLCFLFIIPGFFFEGGSFFMNTLGLTIVNIGFSILVIISMNTGIYLKKSTISKLKKALIPISFIGVNSYSIYLWHLNSKQIIYVLFSFDSRSMAILYILFSVIAGIAMSYLIEKPSIYIRDSALKKHFE